MKAAESAKIQILFNTAMVHKWNPSSVYPDVSERLRRLDQKGLSIRMGLSAGGRLTEFPTTVRTVSGSMGIISVPHYTQNTPIGFGNA
jgi:hypothetical protein